VGGLLGLLVFVGYLVDGFSVGNKEVGISVGIRLGEVGLKLMVGAAVGFIVGNIRENLTMVAHDSLP